MPDYAQKVSMFMLVSTDMLNDGLAMSNDMRDRLKEELSAALLDPRPMILAEGMSIVYTERTPVRRPEAKLV